jgi:hypothetical protein
MYGKCLRVEKLLLADLALEREMTFMLLQMIMHSILILLRSLANLTDVLTGSVLLVCICHVGSRGGAAGGINFIKVMCLSLHHDRGDVYPMVAPITISSHNGYCALHRNSPLLRIRTPSSNIPHDYLSQ